jgi:tRNA(His) 5'-end guanylyltransferase
MDVMAKDPIGDRFKDYERCFDYSLPRRLPMVIRVDGRAFHGLKLQKPFDESFFAAMSMTAVALCKEVQGAVLAYFQSDEISIVARDDMTNTTQPWLGKRLSKIVSLSAAVATTHFNYAHGELRQFDSRAFVLPDRSEVVNYLIWRQQDASRNSVSMAAHAAFSHNSLHKKNTNDMLDMLRDANKPWENTLSHFKRGAIVRPVKVLKLVEKTGEKCERREWQIDLAPPIFTQDRKYLEDLYDQPMQVEGTTQEAVTTGTTE